MSPRRLALVVALLTVTAPRDAGADPSPAEPMPTEHVRVTTGDAELHLLGGRVLVVPRLSHVLAPIAWDKLDAEVRRLQEAEVRLTAENESLRKTARSWQPGWKVVLGTLVAGAALGAYGTYRLLD